MIHSKHIAAAVAAALMACSGAHAAWQVVDTNSRVQTEVDLGTANRKDGVVTGWVQHTFSKKATTQTGAYFVYRTMKEQMRLDLSRQTFQVRVGPSGQNIAEEAGFGLVAIPGDAEAVSVDRRVALGGAMALVDQRVTWAADDLLQEDRRAGVSGPTAHQRAPLVEWIICPALLFLEV